MDICNLLENEPYDDFVRALASLTSSSDVSSKDQIAQLLTYQDHNTLTKFLTPRLACLALLQKGPTGVATLVAVFPVAWGAIGPKAILESLWYASEGRLSTFISEQPVVHLDPPLSDPLAADTVQSARKAIDDLVARSLDDEEVFGSLVAFFGNENMLSFAISAEDKERFRARVFESFAKGRIKITAELLEEFQGLLHQDASEETYQTFLANNPVFLDPLASQVIPKQRLGSEYVTDFVIRRLDEKYVLVEIEKPRDALFTSGDDFSAKFSHALGQVLDFQQWIDSHGEYARTLLPKVSSPKGLLIMGSADTLSERQRNKLHRFNINSSTIQVLTFDEVAHNARQLYQNIYR